MGLIRTALIFGAGYAVGDPNMRRQLLGKANEISQRPEVQGLKDRGRETGARVSEGIRDRGRAAGARVTGRKSSDGAQDAGANGTVTVVPDPSSAPDPAGAEFLESRNPVEKLSPATTADAPATEAGLISTDPTRSKGRPAT